MRRVDGDDFLRKKAKPVGVERTLDASNPFHLAVPHRKLAILGVIDLHAVASLFLGHVARRVSGA